MTDFITAYVFTAVVFLLIDFLWLGFFAKGFYVEQLGALMRKRPNLIVALAFYLIYAAGLVVFAVSPALQSGEWHVATLYGGFLGFLAYATYNFTNMSTLKDWPVLMSVVDLAWGTFISGTSATIGHFLCRGVIDTF